MELLSGLFALNQVAVSTLKYHEDANGRSPYREWLRGLDSVTARRIIRHVDRLPFGLGDIKYLGDKLSELRMDFGPGYRVYFIRRSIETIIVLGGSEKRDQARAIEQTKLIIQNFYKE